MPAAEMRLPLQGLQAPAAHQCGHLPSSHGVALLPQEIAQHAGASKRMGQMQRVDPPPQRASAPSDTGVGWSYAVDRARFSSGHCRLTGTA